MSEEIESKTLRDGLRVIFRRWYTFLVAASVFGIAAIIASHSLPLKYTGTAVFAVEIESAASRENIDQYGSLKQTLIQSLTGRKALEDAIKELNVEAGLPHGPEGQLTSAGLMARQEMVQSFREKLVVQFSVRSDRVDLVTVAFTHSDPNLAEKVPNILVANYAEQTYKKMKDDLTKNSNHLEAQLNNCQKRVRELEEEESRFKIANAGMFPDNPDALQDRIYEINTELGTRRMQLDRSKRELARLQSLDEQSKEPEPTPDGGAAEPSQVLIEYIRLRAHLQDLEEQLTAALLQYTERHPQVRDLRNKIARVRGSLDQLKPQLPQEPVKIEVRRRVAVDVQTRMAAVVSEVETLSADVERMENLLKDYQKRSEGYPVVRRQYLRIANDITDQRKEAAKWDEKFRTVQMALQTQEAKLGASLSVEQTAEKQFRPSSPKLSMILGVAIVGGIAFGAGLVLLLRVLDRTIHTSEDAVRYFDAPVHGVIGEIITPKVRLKRRARRWVVGPAVTVLILGIWAACILSISLKLKAPESYEEWQKSPVQFVMERATEVATSAWNRTRM